MSVATAQIEHNTNNSNNPNNPNTIVTDSFIRKTIHSVTDNGGQSFDRYTVYFRDKSYLGISDNPTSPLGFSQWGEVESLEHQREHQITFDQLPPHIQEHVKARTWQGFEDIVLFYRQSRASDKEITEALLEAFK